MKLADTYNEWAYMRSQGYDDREIARALGIKPKSLERALSRYRSRWPGGAPVQLTLCERP